MGTQRQSLSPPLTTVTPSEAGDLLTVVRRSADGQRAVVVDVGDGVVRVRMLRLVKPAKCRGARGGVGAKGTDGARGEAQSDATLEDVCAEPLDPDDAPAALMAPLRLLRAA